MFSLARCSDCKRFLRKKDQHGCCAKCTKIKCLHESKRKHTEIAEISLLSDDEVSEKKRRTSSVGTKDGLEDDSCCSYGNVSRSTRSSVRSSVGSICTIVDAIGNRPTEVVALSSDSSVGGLSELESHGCDSEASMVSTSTSEDEYETEEFEDEDDDFVKVPLSGNGVKKTRGVELHDEPFRQRLKVCRNCFRRQSTREESETAFQHYIVSLERVSMEKLYLRSAWKTFKRSDLSGRSVLLCIQCQEILTKAACERRRGTKSKITWASIWPVYVWMFLTHDYIMDKFGCKALHFVPDTWHKFWIDALVLKYPTVYRGVELNIQSDGFATVITKDVTMPRKSFCRILKDLRLGEIKQGCDEYLYPLVLCPWGCTEYMQHDGFVDFDAVFSRFFPEVEFAGRVCGKARYEKLLSSRDDFFSEWIDAWYYNPKWSVHPSVVYVAGKGPCFMTCQHHNGGTKEAYFHIPKTRMCLPARNAESLSHAVLRARTLKPVKAHAYSHGYRLLEMRANFTGVDSAIVSETRRFDFASHLTDLNEARSFAGRADIRGLVNRLERTGEIASEFAKNVAQRAEDLFCSSDVMEEMAKGGTMMTLNDCVLLQRMIASPSTMEIKIQFEQPETTRVVKRPWPCDLIRVHPNNRHGAVPFYFDLSTRSSGGEDLRLCWLIGNALLAISKLWRAVSDNVSCTSEWHGYMLLFLSKKATKYKGSGVKKSNPFYTKSWDPKNKPIGLMALLSDFVAVDSNNTWTSARDGFCPAHVGSVLRKEIESRSISFAEFPTARMQNERTLASLCESSAEIFLFHGAWVGRLPERIVGPNGVRLELRFFAWSQDGESAAKWKGCTFVRHGSSCFPGWWKCDRGSRPVKLAGFPHSPCGIFDLAIY